MDTLYSRNRIYITQEEQDIIKDYPILLGGCGIGSNIAECALRLGFENITIIDGDNVEQSNLNRQNYIENDLGISKVHSLKKRLQAINSKAKIKVYNEFLTPQNFEKYLNNCKIAINALDFSSPTPLLFDKKCQELNITVLHPYNLGWAGLVTIIEPKGISFSSLNINKIELNEVAIVEYFIQKLKEDKISTEWLNNIIEKYRQEDLPEPPPQLSLGSWIVAAMCSNLLFRIATDKELKVFPEFYYSAMI